MENNGQIVVGLVGANETKFGEWFLAFLRHLPAVSLLLPEPEHGIGVSDVVKFADVIIFAGPADKLEQTVLEYSDKGIPPGKLWIDVAGTNVPPTEALRDIVADAVSLRFDEPSKDLIECIYLPEKRVVYIYALAMGCSCTNFTYLLSMFQHTAGVKNVQFVRPPSGVLVT